MAPFLKFKSLWNWVGIACVVFISVWMIPNFIESTTPPKRAPITKKVIVSPHLGEVIKDSRYEGEIVKFKIYYHHKESRNADIAIIDPLDDHLSKPNVFHNGTYDATTHKVTWKISNVPPNQQGFVEFEATIGQAEIITNRAEIHIGGLGKKPLTTNTVEIRVLPSPKLGWIPFDGADPAQTLPRSYMKDETTTGLMVNFDIPGMFAYEVKKDGVIYHRLSISGQATMLSEGKPDVPIMGQVVEVPYGVNLGIEVVKAQSITLSNYNVYPAQLQIDAPPVDPGSKPFAVHKATYLTDAYFPDRPAFFSAEDVGIIRGHRLVFFKVNPLQYNPVTKELRAYKNIEIRITYDQPGQIRRVNRRIESAPFEKLLKRLVLNYKAPNRFSETGGHGMVALPRRNDFSLSPLPKSAQAARVEGCDYLILTHGTFYPNPNDPNNPLNRLRVWKQSKGLKVWIVDVANIPGGATAADIKTYLQNAYDTWSPTPAYVLLVGDAEFIPTNYQTDHPSNKHETPAGVKTKVGTDLYYATVDGTDYFPDFLMGRLSVETVGEADTAITKILDYERNPPLNANYYTNMPLVCLFEDDTELRGPLATDLGNGQEDPTFRIIECSESVRDYLIGQGYNVNRIYDQSGNWPQGPQVYENGITSVPPALTMPAFSWNGGTADIRTALNNGSFLATYNGHGGRNSWGRPNFTSVNVNALTNRALIPVVFSMACQTGWFDNETDDRNIRPATVNNDECMCEAWIRSNNGGAVGIIGATRNSYEENDFMLLGFYKAIWHDFNPNPPLGGGFLLPAIHSVPLLGLGQIHTFGKVYLADVVAHDINRQVTFEMYHLFGDPEMPIWTQEPATFQVDHPEGIGSTGTQDFIITVKDNATGDPVENAVVTLMFNGTLRDSQFTNPDGMARFTGSYLAGDLNLTVTAQNYRPYQGIIKVSSGGADLNRLEPPDGPVTQTIHVGGQNFLGNENVDIFFGSSNLATPQTSGGNFGQAGDTDVDIQVPATEPLGPVNIMAKGQTAPDNRYAVDVFQVRSQNPIDLYCYSQWDEDTWHLHAGDNPIWDNPDIQLYDAAGNAVASNNLVAGSQYTIKVKVHNDTNFDADNVKVNLKWAHFGAGQPSSAWTPILPTPEVDVPKTSIEEAEATWVPNRTGHICVVAEIYHVEDINSGNNKGQENCHVGPTASPAQVPFKIWNPTDKPAAMFLEVRQISPEPLWRTTIQHPDPQVIPPGGSTEGVVIIEPVKGVDCQKPADFALTGFIENRIVGGVNFQISCAPVPVGAIGWKCCLLWGVFLASLIAAIVFLAVALSGVGWAWRALAAAGSILLVSGLFLLFNCIPPAWRCCSSWLVFGFGLATALALLIFAYYAKRLELWYAFAITFGATALLGLVLIVYCDAYYLTIGVLLLALLLLALMGYRKFKTSERID